MRFTISLPLIAFSAIASADLGINCRGSGYCYKGALSEISGYIDNIQCGRFYHPGEHIACTGPVKGTLNSDGGVCAFIQGGVGAYGNQIISMVHAIEDHGCQGCGSVPTQFPFMSSASNIQNNPNINGILTVNYVAKTDNPCPPGLC
jgi:hypothetical protein